jgi:acyl-CoA reductase-like NAD-dependent aldehyde dehydrogenase
MPLDLPRVTYSNIGVDFSPVHDHLDRQIPAFEREMLARDWKTPFATGPVREIVSPIDGKILLGRFPQSTTDDLASAMAAAGGAYSGWSSLSLEDRLAFAERWARALQEAKYDLALAALYEIGKSRLEAVGEAEESSDIVAYYASELARHAGYQQKMNDLVARESTKSIMRPFGVFGVISPFNFPLALSVNMITGALITGNTVVYKPSPDCALTGLLLANVLAKAGLPDGVFNIVLGGAQVGETLVSAPAVAGIAFTGSYKTGTAIFRKIAAGEFAKPLIADMGGKNPAYVTSRANIAVAAEGVARSAFGLQGQKCSACSVVYVDKSVKDAFVAALVAYAGRLKIGDPRHRETFMGPVYGAATVARFKAAVEEAQRTGAVLFGGETLGGEFPETYVRPTIVELPGQGRLTREELFMPFLVVRSVHGLEAALLEGNSVNYGLAAGIYSEDQPEIDLFLAKAEAGVLYANRASGATTGAWPGSQPFCGWKGSGVSGKGGLGPHYLLQFMREQSHTIMHWA